MHFTHAVVVLACVFVLRTDGRRTPSRRVIMQDCSRPESPIKITNFDIQPNPVTFPGHMRLTLEGYSNRTIGSSRMELNIKRLGRWIDIPIPCMFKIGSCTHEDMCTMLDRMISENWAGITRQFGTEIRNMLERNGMRPGLCPQPPQEIRIVNERLRLPEIPSILSFFASGLYEARVNVFDRSNGEELVCMVITLQVERQRRNCGWYNPFC